MSDELEVVTIPDPSTVAVVQPDVDVVSKTESMPVIVVMPDIEVVVIGEDVNVVDTIHEISVVTVGEQGPQGIQGDPGSGSAETYVAGEAIGGHRVIVTNSAGKAIYANNTDATHANAATKITLGAAALDDNVEVQLVGRIVEPSFAWTPGATLYVGTNGQMTETVPVSPAVFSKPVAVAEASDTILIIQEPPVMLA